MSASNMSAGHEESVGKVRVPFVLSIGRCVTS